MGRSALAVLQETGALQDGHFQLASGLHSGRYVQCARLLAHPDVASRVARSVARKLVSAGAVQPGTVGCVLGPAIGGVIWAYELARALRCRAIYCEKDETGAFVLRRGFEIEPGSRVVLAEDVVTTGGSVGKAVAIAREAGAKPIAVAAIINRSGATSIDGVPLVAWMALDIPAHTPDECPLCKGGGPPAVRAGYVGYRASAVAGEGRR